MPFTLAHPAIVLPLKFIKKGWLSLTGLITGSMIPDFGYFIQVESIRGYAHSIHGVFWLDLPIAIVIAYVYHQVIRNPFIRNSWPFLQRKLARYFNFNWNLFFKENIFKVVVSIIIGAFSHLAWDSFTHENGYFVQQIPALKATIPLGFALMSIHNLVSFICSFGGLLVVTYSVLQIPAVKNVLINRNIIGYWFTIVFFSLLTFYLKVSAIDNKRIYTYWYLYISQYVVILLSSFCTSLLFTSLLYKYVFQRSLPGAQKNLH